MRVHDLAGFVPHPESRSIELAPAIEGTVEALRRGAHNFRQPRIRVPPRLPYFGGGVDHGAAGRQGSGLVAIAVIDLRRLFREEWEAGFVKVEQLADAATERQADRRQPGRGE